jgi:hypothetical protein
MKNKIMGIRNRIDKKIKKKKMEKKKKCEIEKGREIERDGIKE